MGVAGCGKSTTGAALAKALGWPFRDADSFHPPANIAKMSRGLPLDRRATAARGSRPSRSGSTSGAQLAESPASSPCSALKRAYRQRIIGARLACGSSI